MCMDLTLGVFFASMGAHPALIVILILVIGVTIISGATDAPNAPALPGGRFAFTAPGA